MTDTEALKALVAAIQEDTALQPTVENKEFKIAKAARAAESALERMLASQGAPPLAEPDVERDVERIVEEIAYLEGQVHGKQRMNRKVIAELFRKHLRPTQQTEGASAAPQAEGK